MRSSFVLTKPRLLTIKNRWLVGGKSLLKEAGMAFMSAALMSAIYVCTRSALRDTEKLFEGQLPIDIPLSMVLTTLLAMLLLSSIVTALGALFLSKDLDLILSAPLTRWQFISGKIAEVVIGNGWMLIVFGLPTLIAFGVHFDAQWEYFAFSPIIGLSLLIIPCVVAVLVALILGSVVSPNRGREVFLVLFIVSLGVFVTYLNAPSLTGNNTHSMTEVFDTTPMSMKPEDVSLTGTAAFIKMTSVTSSSWNPIAPCANALAELAKGNILPATLTTVVLWSICILAAFASRFAFELLYERAFTGAQNQRSMIKIDSRSSQRLSRYGLPFVPSEQRALIVKEFKVFSRDIAHTVQLGILLMICFVYLYNFRVLQAPPQLTEDALRWWNAFLMLCNVALSSLVVTSICSRFVFPSVSLEGSSFWILQSSPLTAKEILRTKFKAWFIPLACISSVVFISGAMALNAEGPLVLATCIAGVVFCYGLVGLGVGMGALFSQFDWEYSAQLSTNLGNFLFMVASLVVIALDFIPMTLMYGGFLLLPETPGALIPTSWGVLVAGLGTLTIANVALARWALHIGSKSLEGK